MLQLQDLRSIIISQGYQVSNFVFAETGSQFVFHAIQQNNGLTVKTLQYFKEGMDSALVLVGDSTTGMEGMRISDGNIFFNRGGDKFFFNIEKRENLKNQPADTGVRVDIWNYRQKIDPFPFKKQRFLAAIRVGAEKKVVIRLQHEGDRSVRSSEGKATMIMCFWKEKLIIF